jgi:hypothetical protein
MADAYRLVFVDVMTVYYSYQHPIAFLCGTQLILRLGYWERARGKRRQHIQSIMDDAGIGDGRVLYDSSDNFIPDLVATLDRVSGKTPPPPTVDAQDVQDTKPIRKEKRRVII